MNFLNRKMFANGGGASTPSGPLGPNQIYDTVSGKIYNLDEGFVSDLFLKGRNLYPILKDNTLIKGSNVAAALEKFRDQDEPFDLSKRSFGYFKPRDVGTGLIDAGISIGQFFEPYVKKGIAGIGEFVGSDYLKTADDDVSTGIFGFKRDEMDSIFPTDQERSRAALERITGQRNINPNVNLSQGFQDAFPPKVKGAANIISQIIGRDPIFDIDKDLDELNKPNVVDTATVTEVSGPSGLTPITTSETLSIEGGPGSLEARRLAYEKEMIGRDEFGNLLPEGRLEQDDEISTLLDEIKPIEQKVDVDKTEADTLADNEAKFSGLSEDEFKSTLDEMALPKLPEIERPVTDTAVVEQEELRKQNDPISRKLDQPGFFGSDRFLNFIRNVGGELTRTGQMGAGLAGGASKAAEERAARELMADKEERDYRMKLRLAKAEADLEARNKLAEGYDKGKIATYVEFEDEVATAIKNFDEDERILSDINQILNEEVDKEGAFGVQGFFGKINDKFKNALGYGETEWKNLPAEVKTAKILEITAQRSVRNILGESGKTISNLDREIVARIFGNVDIWTSPAELKKILGNSRDNIIEGLRSGQTQIISRANALNEVGYPSASLQANKSLIDRIMNFEFDNIYNYQLGENSAGYIETTL
jgi:hypothetical protein